MSDPNQLILLESETMGYSLRRWEAELILPILGEKAAAILKEAMEEANRKDN